MMEKPTTSRASLTTSTSVADEKVYGWVLLPVAVDPGHERDPETFEFENDHAYYEYLNGAWGFVSSEEAPTYFDAVRQLDRPENMEL